MGSRRVVVIGVAMLAGACGGRSRSQDAPSSSAGAGGATTGIGGTAGGLPMGSGAGPSSGGSTATPCGRRVVDYLAASPAECADFTFLCAPGSAVFVDDCGCGCTSTPFHEGSRGTPATDTVPDACNGPSGPLALFESSPEQLLLGENEVFVRVERHRGRSIDAWAIDKRTGAVSLAPPWEQLANAAGAVVSGPEPLEVGGVVYSQTSGGALTAASGGEARLLFELPGYGPAFIVIGAELYTSSYDGTLFHGRVDPVVPPVVLEERGELDDDDPYPVIVAADEDAVYWTAGPFSDVQVTDGDPAMLYRTCR